MEQLGLLFDEAEVYAVQKDAEPMVVAAHFRNRKSGIVKDILPENIPVEVVEHCLTEKERSCPQYGEVMTKIRTEVWETLKFILPKAVLQRDVYYTYACRNCEEHDISTPVVKTPKEVAVIPASILLFN